MEKQTKIIWVVVSISLILFFSSGNSLGLFALDSMNYPMASDGIIWLDGSPTIGVTVEYKLSDGTSVQIQEGDGYSTKTDKNGIWTATLLSYTNAPISGKRVYLYIDGKNTGNSFIFEVFGTSPVFEIGDVKTSPISYKVKDELGNEINHFYGGYYEPRNLFFHLCLDGSSSYWCINRIEGIFWKDRILVGKYSLTISNRNYLKNKIYEDYFTDFEILDGQPKNLNIVLKLTDYGKTIVKPGEKVYPRYQYTIGCKGCRGYCVIANEYATEFSSLWNGSWASLEECKAAHPETPKELGYCGDKICNENYGEIVCPQDCLSGYSQEEVEDPGTNKGYRYEETKDNFNGDVQVSEEESIDTDGDGFSDYFEIYYNSNAYDKSSTPLSSKSPFGISWAYVLIIIIIIFVFIIYR